MQITRKTDYGLRAISELARHVGEDIPITAISERHGIPVAFLEKIMQALRQMGLVESTHGRGGGYRLARPANLISVKDVVHALEGPMALVVCLDPKVRCGIEQGCPTSHAWEIINRRFEDSLAALSLHDILNEELLV